MTQSCIYSHNNPMLPRSVTASSLAVCPMSTIICKYSPKTPAYPKSFSLSCLPAVQNKAHGMSSSFTHVLAGWPGYVDQPSTSVKQDVKSLHISCLSFNEHQQQLSSLPRCHFFLLNLRMYTNCETSVLVTDATRFLVTKRGTCRSRTIQ